MNLSDNQRELLFSILHCSAYYKAYFEPMAKNLSRKAKKGQSLSLDLAIKGFMHGTNAAAKQYNLEHGSMTTAWHVLFSASDRRVVAEELARYAIGEIKLNGGWA